VADSGKQRADKRIKKEEKKKRGKKFDYVTLDRSAGQTEVFCKISGAPIKNLKVVSDLSIERQAEGRTVVREAVMLSENSNYAEIEIDFDDGSKHHTVVDKSIVNVLTSDDLETMYAADMKQWGIEESLGWGDVDWDRLSDRLPVGYRRIR
jgi:hypothetical protein